MKSQSRVLFNKDVNKDEFQNQRPVTWFSIPRPKTRASWSRPKPRTFAAHVEAKDTVCSRTFQERLLTQYFITYVGLKYTSSTLPCCHKSILPNFSKRTVMTLVNITTLTLHMYIVFKQAVFHT